MTIGDADRSAAPEQWLQQRLEDLEEALRRIVVVLEPDGQHVVTDRDTAALAVACDVLNLDFPEFDWLAALA